MESFDEVVFTGLRVVMVLGGLCSAGLIGSVFYERYVEGNVDAFKPERRVGPADRRAHVSDHRA